MTIIRSSLLSRSDLRLLGNNLARARKPRPGLGQRRRQQMIVSAINRSLAAVGEQIGQLHPRLALAC